MQDRRQIQNIEEAMEKDLRGEIHMHAYISTSSVLFFFLSVLIAI
jgi:transcriptional regulator of met regulon